MTDEAFRIGRARTLALALAQLVMVAGCTLNAPTTPAPSEAGGGQVSSSPTVLATIPAPSPTTGAATGRVWPSDKFGAPPGYPPGLYRWAGRPGWMHNGYQGLGADGDVSFTLVFSSDYKRAWTDPAVVDRGGPTPLTIAGYDATYEEFHLEGTRREIWIIDIEGRSVTIEVEVGPSSAARGIAEARAIIQSIQVEPTRSSPGFVLLFTLPSGWDSA